MKNYALGLLILFICSFSCLSPQEADKSRIYNEYEVDVKPSYPGGVEAMKIFIKRNLKWPSEYGNSGYVVVLAIVGKNGNIVNSKVKKGLCVFCDTAALQVLKKMPKWSPGIAKGKRVDTEVQIPIRFEISKM